MIKIEISSDDLHHMINNYLELYYPDIMSRTEPPGKHSIIVDDSPLSDSWYDTNIIVVSLKEYADEDQQQ